MKREIKPVPDFVPGTLIYVFEHGEVRYLSNTGWNEEYEADVYEVEDINGGKLLTPAYNCFELKSFSRIWTMGDSAIKVVCGTAYNFHTFMENIGRACEVVYEVNVDGRQSETDEFEVGDLLPIAWRGYGIEFDWLIDRWLRRLEGEVISADDECSIR